MKSSISIRCTASLLMLFCAVQFGTRFTRAQVTIPGTTRQLTTNPTPQIDPAISGDLVVYTDQRNGNDDVYFINVVTGVETQVTTATTAQRLNDVSGNLIAFTDLTSPNRKVMLYDVVTGLTTQAGTGTIDQNPRLDGDLVAFERGLGSAADVWAFDRATNTEIPVATGPTVDLNPVVGGTRVLYQRHATSSSQGDIVMFDTATSTETVLEGTASDARRPDIDGNIVVWDVLSSPNDTDIAIHDLSTGVTQVFARPGNQRSPHVSGQVVAFDDDSAGTPDIMLYHIPSGQFVPVAISSGSEFLNDISGNRIVYDSNQAGNNDIWLFEFNRPPDAVCQNVTRAVGANCQAVVTAQDVGGGSSDPDGNAITLKLDPVGPFTVGTHTVALTVTDSQGESAQCNATVTVVDNTPPVISCPANPSVAAPLGQCSANVSYSVIAADNCSPSGVACSPPSGSSFNVGTTPVACVASDQSGNIANCSFSVRVNDTQPPSITCPANVTTTAATGAGSAIVGYATPTVIDNCSGNTVACAPPSGSNFPIGPTMVNCVATDAAGNTGQCSFTVTVNSAPASADRIAFETNRDGNFEIYSMDPSGSNPTRLTFNSASDISPAWSPDHTRIAFASARDGNLEIYSMNADGTNQTRLTFTSAVEDDPSWSPDGAKIAFWSSRDGNQEIYVMNANGTNQTRITSNSRSDTQPQWSPDSTKLVFVSNRSNLVNFDIYVMNADGTNATRLTTTSSIDESPDWSPDGTKIVFTSNRSNLLDFEIWVMNANGSNQTQLTSSTRSSVRPTWSGDGTKITFATNRDSLLNFEIYTMDANGSSQTRITTNSAIEFDPDR